MTMTFASHAQEEATASEEQNESEPVVEAEDAVEDAGTAAIAEVEAENTDSENTTEKEEEYGTI